MASPGDTNMSSPGSKPLKGRDSLPNPPLVSAEDIEELLESGAKRAAASNAAKRDAAHSPRTGRRLSGHSSDGSSARYRPSDDTRRTNERDRYRADRAENDERRSRRMHNTAHPDTDPDSGRDSANGSAGGKRRSRSPARRRGSNDHSDYRERDRPQRGDIYVGGGRREDDSYRPGRYNDRSRPQDMRRSSRDRSPDRRRNGRDRSRDGRRDDRDIRGGRGGERRDRRRSPPPRRARTPEAADDDSDRRTVFVNQLAARLRTKELLTFFERAGKVVDAQIVKDRVSGRSKGVGYVEFEDEASVAKAIALTGQKLLGIPIIAMLTEAEKNRQARNTEGTATQSNGIPFHRLYVGNIHFNINEEDLKNVFQPFGELEFVQLQKEDNGRSKGYGFVQFVDPTQAKEALEKMNGFDIGGRPIRVGLGNDKFTPESTQSLLQRFGSQAQQPQFQGSAFSGSGGRGSHAGGTGNFDRGGGRDAERAGGAGALDDSDVGGVNFSNVDRSDLMRKLARLDDKEQRPAARATAQPPAPAQPARSRCVLLKHMFDQTKETKPGWQDELKDDVKTECTDKYGIVVHIALSLENNDGEIYVKFDRVEGGENAIRGLNGRFFDGRMIAAQYVSDAIYNSLFPRTASL